MSFALAVTLAVLAALALASFWLFFGRALLGWLFGTATLLLFWRWQGVDSPLLFNGVTIALIAIAVLFGIPPIRRLLISSWLIGPVGKMLPRLGDTERIALEAGTVWWDAELFSGRPDWKTLLGYPLPSMSDEEQAFLAGPVEKLCDMLDDWDIHQRRDLPPEAWEFIRRERFFGMLVPKKYGGLEFSSIAQARIVTRISSRSAAAAVTVMVPNSLGPAELLLHYGTDEQKDYYLPRLADGREIPCFGLTGPEAGSDAAATQSEGIVEKRVTDGKEVLGLRLNWKKRYITLAPVATLIGLAFRLKDPQGLLGGEEDRGITCALIPRDTDGIEIGQRHDPMGVPFMNGPIVGRDVFIPIDAIIGGEGGIGHGWRMLMESLAAGRSISLPALSVGAAQMATRVTGAYATVREQFDTPIGRFEGIEEPLARIAGKTYLMTAARTLTCAAIDLGEKPSVLSAIIKAYLTQGMREVVTDAMDIRAGAAIQRGPRNILSNTWSAVPIGITVEGANILTRSMIVYGQGAIRCHPFVQQEIDSVAKHDVKAFDAAIFGHLAFVPRNKVRAWLLALTGSRLAAAPSTPLRRELQHFSRFSAGFAFLSDVAMGTLGGKLKRKEKLSGRLADALAWMYLGSAAVKRYESEEKSEASLDLARWSCWLALYEIQQALGGAIDNFPVNWLRSPLSWVLFPLGRRFRYPGDRMGSKVARSILEDREARIRLTGDIHVPGPDEPGLGRLEKALDEAMEALPIEAKLRDLVRNGLLDRAPGHELDDHALEAGLISQDEYDRLNAARDCRNEVIQVDAFDPEAFRTQR